MTVSPPRRPLRPVVVTRPPRGPCYRPEGHPKTGHISKAALDAKRAKGKFLTPEQMEAKEAERALGTS